MSVRYSKTEYGFVNMSVDIITHQYSVSYCIGNSKAGDKTFTTESEADEFFNELCNELEDLTNYLED